MKEIVFSLLTRLESILGMVTVVYQISRELEIVKIELVEDFFVELMLAAKFPHPLPTVSLGVY